MWLLSPLHALMTLLAIGIPIYYAFAYKMHVMDALQLALPGVLFIAIYVFNDEVHRSPLGIAIMGVLVFWWVKSMQRVRRDDPSLNP